MILKYSKLPISRIGMKVHIDEIQHGEVFISTNASSRYHIGIRKKVRYNNWIVSYPFTPREYEESDSNAGYFSEDHSDITGLVVEIVEEGVF